MGFRNKDLVILEDEFKAASSVMKMMTDDGSYGTIWKIIVIVPFSRSKSATVSGILSPSSSTLIEAGNQYDEVIAIGPLIMMKFVCKLTKEYNIKMALREDPQSPV